MRKFKLFFYPFYIITTLVVLYFTIDILLHLDAYKEKVDFILLRKLPHYMLLVFLLLTVVMSVEIIIENIHITRLRRKAADAEEEVMKLKAKLYDQAQTAPVDRGDEDEDPDDFLLDDEDER